MVNTGLQAGQMSRVYSHDTLLQGGACDNPIILLLFISFSASNLAVQAAISTCKKRMDLPVECLCHGVSVMVKLAPRQELITVQLLAAGQRRSCSDSIFLSGLQPPQPRPGDF